MMSLTRIISKSFPLEKIFSSNKKFILFVMVCNFLISAEYSITRPASSGIFLTLFSANYFPSIWICTVPINFLIIYLYNQILPKLGCVRTFLLFAFVIISINTSAAFGITKLPIFCFLQFIWKDIYILLMFKQIWSMIHTTVDVKKARYLYGLLFGIGGLGSTIGGIAPSFFAITLGSQSLFFFTLPMYLAVFLFYFLASKESKIKKKQDEGESFKESLSKGGFSLIFSSKFLFFILLIVVGMQLSISLVDYQINDFVERNILKMDLRTQFMGRICTLTNVITTLFQLFGGFLFLRFLGLKRSHLFVPIFLCVNACAMLFFPSFLMASYMYVSIKSVDYSIFSIAREMLYIPMSLEEKFRAKAVIDVFAYRSAKALGSFLLLFLQFLGISYLIGSLSIIIFFIWAVCVLLLFKHCDNKQIIFEKTS